MDGHYCHTQALKALVGLNGESEVNSDRSSCLRGGGSGEGKPNNHFVK